MKYTIRRRFYSLPEIATTDAVTERLAYTWNAIGLVFGLSAYRRLALVIFVPALTLYAFGLPVSYTGGTIGLVSLRLLTPALALLSLALAAALSLALTMTVFAYRATADRRSCGLTAGAMLSSLLPTSLCCTPVVPTLLALAGASTPRIFSLAGPVQGFFATYELPILVMALALMLSATHLAAKSLSGIDPLALLYLVAHPAKNLEPFLVGACG